jgi:hypothetical protein
MSYELIMLLGFFGTALLGLLPAAPLSSARGRSGHVPQQRSDGGTTAYRCGHSAGQVRDSRSGPGGSRQRYTSRGRIGIPRPAHAGSGSQSVTSVPSPALLE